MDREAIHEQGGFMHDHPAEWDQRTAELADKLVKADGFIIYVYTREGEDDDGNIIGEGHAVVGGAPGIPLGQFLKEGINSINETIVSFVQAHKEEHKDGEAEG